MPCLALLMNEYADKQIKKTQKTMPVSISFNVSLCLLKNCCKTYKDKSNQVCFRAYFLLWYFSWYTL